MSETLTIVMDLYNITDEYRKVFDDATPGDEFIFFGASYQIQSKRIDSSGESLIQAPSMGNKTCTIVFCRVG
jgi:hypothetical protein